MPRIRALYSDPGEGGQGGWMEEEKGGGGRWEEECRGGSNGGKGCPYSRGMDQTEKEKKNQNRNGSNESEMKMYQKKWICCRADDYIMLKNRRRWQLCSTGRRLRAATWFHIKVNMNADNAWKPEPLNARLFLLSSHLHSHQLCFISAAGANFTTTGHSSGVAPHDESVTETAESCTTHMLPDV